MLKRLKILVLGDSLSTSYGDGVTSPWPSYFERKLKTKVPKSDVINLSRGFRTVTEINKYASVLLHQICKPHVLFIQLGLADMAMGSSYATLFTELQTLAKMAQDNGAVVVLVGTPNPDSISSRARYCLSDVYSEVATKGKLDLIPCFLKHTWKKDALTIHDRLHPTDDGHKLVAAHIWDELYNKDTSFYNFLRMWVDSTSNTSKKSEGLYFPRDMILN